MARKKSPAYQRYPQDYLSDENVAAMTLEEEGAYNRLMEHCWLEGSVPADIKRLATLCKNISTHRPRARTDPARLEAREVTEATRRAPAADPVVPG